MSVRKYWYVLTARSDILYFENLAKSFISLCPSDSAATSFFPLTGNGGHIEFTVGIDLCFYWRYMKALALPLKKHEADHVNEQAIKDLLRLLNSDRIRSQNLEVSICDGMRPISSWYYQIFCTATARFAQKKKTVVVLGPFIREKISRGLHKTQTPRINGTKSTFTAFSSRGISWPGSLYSYK